jgi:hypothetical protein
LRAKRRVVNAATYRGIAPPRSVTRGALAPAWESRSGQEQRPLFPLESP